MRCGFQPLTSSSSASRRSVQLTVRHGRWVGQGTMDEIWSLIVTLGVMWSTPLVSAQDPSR